MQTHFRHAAIALALVAGTGTAGAQTWVADMGPPVVAGPALQLSVGQRTTIYRTILPQGRGPIVRERIVTEPVVPVAPAPGGYAVYDDDDDYADAPPVPPRAVPGNRYGYGYQDYAFAVGSRVPPSVRLAPLPAAVVAEVPAVQPYRYMVFNNRVLLVDPVTSIVVADVTPY